MVAVEKDSVLSVLRGRLAAVLFGSLRLMYERPQHYEKRFVANVY
jgi:hypothetical protein